MAERSDVRWEGPPQQRGRSSGEARIAGWVLLVGALGLVSVLGLLVTAPGERGELLDGVPRELAGRWATQDPRYAGRSLIVEPDRVELTLEMGPAGRARHPIVNVRGWQEGASRTYSIRYSAPGGEQIMEVSIARDGTLRLKNPHEVVWRRIQ